MATTGKRFFHLAALVFLLGRVAVASDSLTAFNEGTAEFNAGSFDAASASFRRVIAMQSPLAPAAGLYLAKCYRRQNRWNDALETLATLNDGDENLAAGLADERRRLGDALRTEATARLEAGANDEALPLFDFALRNGKDADAFYGRSLTLVALGRRREAGVAFRQFLAEFPEHRFAADARDIADRLTPERGRGPFVLRLEAGGGYDSNIFLTADASKPVSAAAARFGLLAEARLLDDGGYFGSVGYRGSWLEHINQLSGRYTSHTVQGQLGFADEEWLLRMTPWVAHQTVGTDPYLLQAASTFDVERFEGAYGIGAQYEISRSYGQIPAYSYATGWGHWGDVHFDLWASPFQLRFLYALGLDDIQDLVSGPTRLPLANVGHGPGARIYWSSSDGWDALFSVSVLFRRYLRTAEPGRVLRDDQQIYSSLRIAKKISQTVALFASGSLLVNRSSLDGTNNVNDRNYLQVISLVGVSWNALE